MLRKRRAQPADLNRCINTARSVPALLVQVDLFLAAELSAAEGAAAVASRALDRVEGWLELVSKPDPVPGLLPCARVDTRHHTRPRRPYPHACRRGHRRCAFSSTRTPLIGREG